MKFDTSTVLVTVLGCLFSYRITQIIQIRVQIITNILVSKWMHNLHYIYYIYYIILSLYHCLYTLCKTVGCGGGGGAFLKLQML